MSNAIQVEHRDSTTIITMNNPKTRNALSSDMVIALTDALRDAGAAPECRVIILTGADGHFSSGGDVSAMSTDRTMLSSRQRVERAHSIIRLINGGPKPVIAAVEGVAFGLGLSLVAACDYVVGHVDSSYCAVFNKVGLSEIKEPITKITRHA